MSKPIILIVYEYFYPGYKAGGPIQSLVNMVLALQQAYTFKVLTTAFDLQANAPYTGIQLNSWNSIQLNSNTQPIEIWYSATPKITMGTFKRIIQESDASTIYINGLFTQWFLQPLLLHKLNHLKGKQIIICPRGMLQAGALSVKPFKKKVFLALLKRINLFKGIRWHATNQEEANDIRKNISTKAAITVASNIPKPPVSKITFSNKVNGKLFLVYLSLITQKKNLLLVLDVLKNCKANIHLSIYGPIKDKAYWHQCQQLIQQMPNNITVKYKGDVQPFKVQETIAQYNAFISLTKGENFGHALFEALGCGRPLITSYFTPWKNLEEKQAGWNVDINSTKQIKNLFEQIAAMNEEEFRKFCIGSINFATEYYLNNQYTHQYKELFL